MEVSTSYHFSEDNINLQGIVNMVVKGFFLYSLVKLDFIIVLILRVTEIPEKLKTDQTRHCNLGSHVSVVLINRAFHNLRLCVV